MREDSNSFESRNLQGEETKSQDIENASSPGFEKNIPDYPIQKPVSPLNSGSRAMNFGKFSDGDYYGRPLEPGNQVPDNLTPGSLSHLIGVKPTRDEHSNIQSTPSEPTENIFSQSEPNSALDEQLEAELMAEIGAQAPSLFINPLGNSSDLNKASTSVMDGCHSLIDASNDPVEPRQYEVRVQNNSKIPPPTSEEAGKRAESLLHHAPETTYASPPTLSTRMLTSSAFIALAIFGGAFAYSGQSSEIIKQTEQLLFARLSDENAKAIFFDENQVENVTPTARPTQPQQLTSVEATKSTGLIVREITPGEPDKPISDLREVLGVAPESATGELNTEIANVVENIPTKSKLIITTPRKHVREEGLERKEELIKISERFGSEPERIPSTSIPAENAAAKVNTNELAFANTKNSERLKSPPVKILSSIEAIERFQPISAPIKSTRNIDELRINLANANGNQALNSDQQDQLLNKLAAGDCVADSLVSVAGKVSPVLMRDLLNSLDAKC